MTDHIKALITTYGAACARVARAPRLSPAQDEALRLERVAHDALVAAVDESDASLGKLRSALAGVVRAWESVPGGGMVHVNIIQRWLVTQMKPEIDKVRQVLGKLA